MLLLSVTSILTLRYHSIVGKGCTWPPNAPLEPAGCHNSILWYRSMSISSTLSARIILAASFVVSKVPLLWCCLSGTLELAIIFTIEQAVHFYTCIWQGQSKSEKGREKRKTVFCKREGKGTHRHKHDLHPTYSFEYTVSASLWLSRSNHWHLLDIPMTKTQEDPARIVLATWPIIPF